MNFTEEIIALIQKAKRSDYSAGLKTTISIAQEYKEITDHPELINKLLSLVIIYDDQKKHLNALSPRESQIFKLIGIGLTTRNIASTLKISEGTVSTHRKNIIKKLRISGPGQLKNIAFRYTNAN